MHVSYRSCSQIRADDGGVGDGALVAYDSKWCRTGGNDDWVVMGTSL